MKIITKHKVGGTVYELEVEESKDMEALHKSIVLSNPPKYCTLCQNQEYFEMDTNKDKDGNIYVNIRCTKCQGKAKIGQYKAGGYFWHKFEKYNPTPTTTTDSKPTQEEPPVDDENFNPFDE